MSIYKPCDIRGTVATELTPELYRNWGRALALQVQPHETFVAGGDVRRSTPQFLGALVDGLLDAGVNVVDLGILPTPMVYFAQRLLQAMGCAIVTASHNPAEINGLKWMIGERPPTEPQVKALQQAAEVPSDRAGPQRRPPRSQDVSADYLTWLKRSLPTVAPSPVRHIVLDPFHGCWAGRAKDYLQTVFPDIRFSAIRDTPHPDFGGLAPDCSRPKHLAELCTAVRRQGADLGAAFDGDGDRVALVDGDGTPLSAEETTLLLLETLADTLGGEPFVHDLKFSDQVPQAARRLGATSVAERSGHAFIRARMLECQGLFGAEISGHYFFGQLQGGDDGLYTAARLIAHLAQSGQTLAELRRACPPVFITPDLRLPVESHARRALIGRVRAAWPQYPQTTLDGVRVDFPEGWALVRSSVTESALTFRFEAADGTQLDRLVQRFCEALPELGNRLRGQYERAMDRGR